MNKGVSNQKSAKERASGVDTVEQSSRKKSSASERANGQMNGPVLASEFFWVGISVSFSTVHI